MSDRENFIKSLERYSPADAKETADKAAILQFLKTDPIPFVRHNMKGHLTGSAWVLSPDCQEVLLTHHAFLNKWMQLGGHADGEANILNVALREAQEESGIDEIKPFSNEIFDVDAHEIPANARKGESEHMHYDIRYLFIAQHKNYRVSSESKELKWVTLEEARAWLAEENLLRILNKWEQFLQVTKNVA